MLLIAGLLLSVAATPPEDYLYYRIAESASPEDIAKAAQAMTTRCRNYGYKGVQTAVIEREGRKVVQVTCEGGRTPEMKAVLNGFGRMSGSAVELRFPVVLTDVEKEQYRPGDRPADDKAPAGTKWFRFRNVDEAPVLLRDELVVTRGEIQMRMVKDRSGSPKSFWDISQLPSREIRDAERKGKLGTPYLIMDGWAIEAVTLNTLEKNEEGKVVPAARLYFTPTSRIVQEALANPMPFMLQNEEETAQ